MRQDLRSPSGDGAYESESRNRRWYLMRIARLISKLNVRLSVLLSVLHIASVSVGLSVTLSAFDDSIASRVRTRVGHH